MEHIIITQLDDDFVRLTAEQGYSLYSKNLRRTVSEAVVAAEKIRDFEARVNQ